MPAESKKISTNSQKKNIAGGSAAASGMNFQAAVTAIATIHVAKGSCLGWLEGLIEDVPVTVRAETGGPGDDIQICYKNGALAEIQIKRGLNKGERLWEPLLELSSAIYEKSISYGLLIVCPETSSTIRNDLARDIRRVGDGRTDALKSITKEFQDKLNLNGLPVSEICQQLRIVTLHCLTGDSASINAAQSELGYLCQNSDQIKHAWDCLYSDATRLIEHRGQRTSESVMRVLGSAGISINTKIASIVPVSVIATLTEWTLNSYISFSIFGINKSLSLDAAWIPLKTVVPPNAPLEETGLAKAVERYHSWDKHQYARDTKDIDPETIGRFVRQCAVIAGPGMGKSTLLKKLARVYSRDGYPTLLIRLPILSARIKLGSSFEEGVFALGLDGSGLRFDDVARSGVQQWVILCDGLDECGSNQDSVCQGLLNFAAGYPQCRIIVTTRPIGYTTTLFKHWRHYELLPLDTNDVKSHAAKILGGIYDPESNNFKRTQEFTDSQLNENEVCKVVARSPLLLGFVVTLALREINLGQSKTQLYEKLFRLINEAPSTRSDSTDIDKPVLIRFLDVLGWHLQMHPYDLVESVLQGCRQVIGQELQLPPLKASSVCEQCLHYWEQIGMLEKLHYAGDETITFVHKTFGEYAAARYLKTIREEDQIKTIASELENESSMETLTFAGSMGLANIIADEMLMRASEVSIRNKMLRKALTLVCNAETPPDPSVRSQIIDAAIDCIVSSNWIVAVTIAEALLDVCLRFPSEVCKQSMSLTDHEQPWIKLAAWTYVTTGGIDYYEYEKLIQIFHELPQLIESLEKPFLSPALHVFREGKSLRLQSNGKKLIEEFVASAIQEIITRGTAEEADVLIQTVLTRILTRVSVKGVSRIITLLNYYGKNELADSLSVDILGGFSKKLVITPKHKSKQDGGVKQIFRAMGFGINPDASFIRDDLNEVSPLLQLSAFLDASGFMEMGFSQILGWQEPFDVEAVQETLRGIIKISGIELDRFNYDLRSLLLGLEIRESEGEFTYLYKRTTRVDTKIDWDMVQSISLDILKLERALHHQSDWIVQLAANLLINKASNGELVEIVERVLETGENTALWAAAQIAKQIEPTTSIKLILDRLKRTLVSGCQYLFQILAELNVTWDAELLIVLRKGLLTLGPLTATEAAKVAFKLAKPSLDDLASLLQEAYRYWQQHEKPYPIESGVIPDSPRAQILSALFRINSPNQADLLLFVNDVRSDVCAIAEAELFRELANDNKLRDAFLFAVGEMKISHNLLSQSIQLSVPFSEVQRATICQLLTHQDARIRFAAMKVLNSNYLPQDQINYWARHLLNDVEQEIRENVKRLLV